VQARLQQPFIGNGERQKEDRIAGSHGCPLSSRYRLHSMSTVAAEREGLGTKVTLAISESDAFINAAWRLAIHRLNSRAGQRVRLQEKDTNPPASMLLWPCPRISTKRSSCRSWNRLKMHIAKATTVGCSVILWRKNARNPGGNGCSSADLDPVRPSVFRRCSPRHISDSWRNCCNCCHVLLSCQLNRCCDRDRAQIPKKLGMYLRMPGNPSFER
jgi:hypothetical protein